MQRLPHAIHRIARELVDDNAINVTETLSAAGFQALLVGGCVRDLLLGHVPKDFDVATDATPEQVKQLFRRARLVGRRFRIAHVRYGRELIEVSTFRKGALDDDEEASDDRLLADTGLLLRDNLFGTLEEDAFRRDFTVNALYYDPATEEVLDFHHGMADLKARRLRLIGDPATRLQEDPVRLLRAIRFQAKLDFDLDPAIEALAHRIAELLDHIPPARLFDEVVKLLLTGKAQTTWALLIHHGVVPVLFPATPPDCPVVLAAMANTDQRVAAEKPVTPGFLIAVLLWKDYQARVAELETEHRPAEAAVQAADEAVRAQAQMLSIPRRFSYFAKDAWQLQRRLEERQKRVVIRLVTHQRFRAAYDLLALRCREEPELEPIYQWWTDYQEATEAEQEAMRETLSSSARGRRRRRKRRKPGSAD